MSSFVLGFQEIDKTKLMVAGGKGANLGELSRLDGIRVPDGFCVTTKAYRRIIGETPRINDLLNRLELLKVADRKGIADLSGEIRAFIEGVAVPEDIAEEVVRHLSRQGEENAYAVRSSATAEDLPTASFAGQQDTYLNIIGREAILKHISKCWASLFTDRAVTYRLQNGFDHRKVALAVVVQQMVFPQASGILFTTDPLSSNRMVVSIDASFGLGEALVSGLVNADNYKVFGKKITAKKISTKKLAIYALKEGGTGEMALAPERQNLPALANPQILELARMGRTIEEHFGRPQDIEWCLVGNNTFYIVQSRPITTLFPAPVNPDGENHVYVSVGHQQMMTDPVKPLGISFRLLITPATMLSAGGRFFVDVTRQLSVPASRKALLKMMGENDPLMKDALLTVANRKDFIKLAPAVPDVKPTPVRGNYTQKMTWSYLAQFENNPTLVPDLIEVTKTSVAALKQNIVTKSGPELIEFIREDLQEFKRVLFNPQSSTVIRVGMYAWDWLNKKMLAWLGEERAADILSHSVPFNITSEMGLDMMDVGDVIRPYPQLVDYLETVKEDNARFLDQLPEFEGGKEAGEAIAVYLDKYGMRCAGEIDITRTRWSENPAILVPSLLTIIKNFEPGASKRKFEQGQREAAEKEQELIERLEQLPDGKRKARETRRMIGLLRGLSGYREYPKYGMVCRYYLYKEALLKEAEKLVRDNVIAEKEDIFYLYFDELAEVIRTRKLDSALISQRKEDFKLFEKLTPSRVLTSDGEGLQGSYRRQNLPAGVLVGLAVSSGVIEGRARVVLKMEDAELEEGDILVTTFTDPSWTPLFVSIKGLVTEVGGLMTHGAVIAREYGIPAVVSVDNATALIKDGQRIRVHGTEGYVQLL